MASHPSLTGRSRQARGELRRQLLDHAVELVVQDGPEAMSLREVQRRAQVSPAAAYRHYRDRDALLIAVGRRAASLLADDIRAAVDNSVGSAGRVGSHTPLDGASEAALARLRRGCRAYLTFAEQHPQLFRTIFLTGESPHQLEQPDAESLGSAGRGAYQILQDCLAELADTGAIEPADRAWSDTTIWASTHGLAVLLLDSPLRHLDSNQRRAATERMLDVLLGGLTGPSVTLNA